jgi:hypothetical protein
MTLVGGGPVTNPRSVAGRFFLVVWMFGMLILVATYTASLASFLTIRQQGQTVETIEEVKRLNLQVGIFDSDFARKTIKPFISESQMSTRGLRKPEDFIEVIINGTVDVIVEGSVYAYDLVARDCRLMVANDGATFSSHNLAWAVQSGSLLYSPLRQAMVDATHSFDFEQNYEMALEAVLANSTQKQEERGIVCPSSVRFVESQIIQFNDLKYLFFILLASGVVAVAFKFLSERFRRSKLLERYFLASLTAEQRRDFGLPWPGDDFLVEDSNSEQSSTNLESQAAETSTRVRSASSMEKYDPITKSFQI